MRDIVLTIAILGTIPWILRAPWIGVVVSAFVSLLSPHRFAWGFAYEFPFAQIIAGATALSMVLHWSQVRLPRSRITLMLLLLPLWMSFTTIFALEPQDAMVRWIDVLKVFFFVLVAAALIHDRRQIHALVWIIVVSIGFYGVKGGIFTLASGGGNRVYGPPGKSFISDNNAIAVALIMTIPLMYYFVETTGKKWLRYGLLGAMAFSGMAVLGTQSRGALIGVSAMLAFLWLKSDKKIVSGLLMLCVVPVAVGFMPDSWTGRMKTIGTYEQDTSAMGRINSWKMAFNLANDRPFVGGGFEPYSARTFERYAPNHEDIHSAHSIYFQMLGEHGYVGLLLFLSIGVAAWRLAAGIDRRARGDPELLWAAKLARAIQVSLIGFAAGGAFVNIGYWELQYYEIVILLAIQQLLPDAAARTSPTNPERSTARWERSGGRPAR